MLHQPVSCVSAQLGSTWDDCSVVSDISSKAGMQHTADAAHSCNPGTLELAQEGWEFEDNLGPETLSQS